MKETQKNTKATKTLSPEEYVTKTMALRKRSLVPSDYIMSSWDIAGALCCPHIEIVEKIEEMNLLSGFLEDTCHTQARVRIAGASIKVYLFDFETVSFLAEYVLHTDASNKESVRNAVLSRFFELASNPTPITKKFYQQIFMDMTLESVKRKKFETRLAACMNAAVIKKSN